MAYEERAGDGSTAQQAKEQAREKASEVQDKAREQAQRAKGQARERVREQVDQRSTQAGERIGGAASDARSVADELRRQGKETPAKYAEQAAERADRLGGYLRDSDGDTILRDVEDFARRKPWAVAAGGLALGFAASRLLKASSRERYRSLTAGDGETLRHDPAGPPRSEPAYGSSASGTPSPAVQSEPTLSRRG
jgi:hypothetical protein